MPNLAKSRERGAAASWRLRRIPVDRLGVRCDLLRLHRRHPARYPHLLESAATGTPQARYDILFAFPGETLELTAEGVLAGSVAVDLGVAEAPGDRRGRVIGDQDFLAAFDRWWERESGAAADRDPDPPEAAEGGTAPPFTGGWFVFLGYELAGQIEPTLKLPPAPHRLPVAFATRFPAAVILDHEAQEVLVVAEADREHLLSDIGGDLRAAWGAFPEGAVANCLSGELIEDPPRRYLDGVRKCIDYVFAGDVFQVNLSRAWQGRLAEGLSHADLYARLRSCNPAPFAGLATLGPRAIISSSPERLIEVRGRVVQTRPIAGTRPRGASGITDVALSEELLAHPKERAEHIMLLDLERNDISRVCVPGSVKVSEMMVLESYTHVHHIVSNVRGELAPAITPGRVVRAVFPGGTITGCPKVRCMEIITELEQVGRGPYTGSMGYINRDGSLDLNILIRTMVREGSAISLRAGSGIVADSEPERELEETRAKAMGLIRALVESRSGGL